jgi:hypothetical protein
MPPPTTGRDPGRHLRDRALGPHHQGGTLGEANPYPGTDRYMTNK